MLLHGFQEGGLDLARGPVDLVGQEEVGEDGADARGEGEVPGVKDQGPHHVGRQEVRRELDPPEGQVAGGGQGLDGAGLGQTGQALQQHVARDQEGDQQALQHLGLPHDHLPAFVQ